jgi:hypothetical protein
MKTYTCRLFAITGLVAMLIGTASVVSAQTFETIANVPFTFTAGAKSLPRGRYTLSTLPGHTDVVLIRSFDHGVIVLSRPEGPSRTDSTPRLVFDRYDDQYFLREIRLADNVGFQLPQSAGEAAAAEHMAADARPDVVVVRVGQ